MESLPFEAVSLIGEQLGEPMSLGRFARVSKSLNLFVMASDGAWQRALEAVGGHRSTGSAYIALRDLITLGAVRWHALGERLPAPAARHHHAVFACNRGSTLIVYGGRTSSPDHNSENGTTATFFSDTWALDVRSGAWHRAAVEGLAPSPRCFSADDRGGGVLQDATGTEYLVLFGGLRPEGFRDNATFILGPLGSAADARTWRWLRLPDGDSPGPPPAPPGLGAAPVPSPPPEPRFHHQLTAVGTQSLIVSGGHNYMLQALMDVHEFSLAGVSLRPSRPAPASVADSHPERLPDGLSLAGWVPVGHGEPAGSSPSPRANHMAVAWNSTLVIVGGERWQELLDDTWLLDTLTGRWRRVRATLPGGGRALAAIAITGDTLVIAGGLYNRAHHSASSAHAICTLNLRQPDILGWLSIATHATLGDVPRCDMTYVGAGLATLHRDGTFILFGGHTGAACDVFGDPLTDFHPLGETWAFRITSPSALRLGPTLRCAVRVATPDHAPGGCGGAEVLFGGESEPQPMDWGVAGGGPPRAWAGSLDTPQAKVNSRFSLTPCPDLGVAVVCESHEVANVLQAKVIVFHDSHDLEDLGGTAAMAATAV